MLNLEDTVKFEMAEDLTLGTKIKVVGIGGGGGNAVARMMQSGLGGVEFYALNTDRQALIASAVPNKLALGAKTTNGLGAGSDPVVGRQAALEDTERIIEILEGADMVFVTAGLGGGTGTGAAPVVASLAKELGALTVAVVTRPFQFEGLRRRKLAERGLAELAATVDTIITIPNDRLLEVSSDDTTCLEAFQMADDVLLHAVQGISDIITTPGVINRDFSDIRAIMQGMGHAMMSTAAASSPSRAVVEAARQAINCPLLEDGGVTGARGLLINITSSRHIRMREVSEACLLIADATGNEDVHVHFGMVVDEQMGDQVKVTVIATGFDRGAEPAPSFEIPRVKALAARAGAAAGDVPRVEAAPMAEPEPAPVEPVFETAPELPAALEPEPEMVEPAPFEPVMPPPPPPRHEPPRQESMPLADVDTPAFLRRERRLFH